MVICFVKSKLTKTIIYWSTKYKSGVSKNFKGKLAIFVTLNSMKKCVLMCNVLLEWQEYQLFSLKEYTFVVELLASKPKAVPIIFPLPK